MGVMIYVNLPVNPPVTQPIGQTPSLQIIPKSTSATTSGSAVPNRSPSTESAHTSAATPVVVSSTATSTPTYIFPGALLEKVGDEPMNGQPAQQFYVDVDTRKIFPDQTGNVQGEIIISTNNLSLQGGSSNISETFEFYTTYNPDKNWYEVIKMQPYTADFY